MQLRTDELIVDVSVPQTQEKIKRDAGVGPISALSVDDKHIEELVPVDQHSQQQQTIYDSLVSDSPPHPRAEETSPRAPVDEYDNRHIEERVPVDQYSQQQQTTYDSHVSDPPPLPRIEETSVRFPVDESDNRHIGELVVNVYRQATLLDIVFDAMCELAGEDARLLRMPSRMSIDARLPRTNREVLSNLNGTEISMASAQGDTHGSRSAVKFFSFSFFERHREVLYGPCARMTSTIRGDLKETRMARRKDDTH